MYVVHTRTHDITREMRAHIYYMHTQSTFFARTHSYIICNLRVSERANEFYICVLLRTQSVRGYIYYLTLCVCGCAISLALAYAKLTEAALGMLLSY